MYNDNIRNKIIEIGKKWVFTGIISNAFKLRYDIILSMYLEDTLSEVGIDNDEYVV